MLIDERGRLFGKINVIDFIVLLFVLCLLPVIPFAYKIMNKPQVIEIATHYEISKNCPNCEHPKNKKIPLGELKPLEWSGVCKGCKNEVMFIKPKPKPKPNYEYIYKQIEYKQLFKEKGWLE